MTLYGVTTNYEYNASHRRDRVDVWSGGFMSDHEATGYSCGDGYMLHLDYGGKVRVQCPIPRNDVNYIEVDAAINAAMNQRRGHSVSVIERLEYLRQEIHAQRISWGEIAELQSLASHIDPSDVELLEWAGVLEK